MGDLLLCNGPIAKIPYYIEGVSVNIYSMEELCYYIANNTYLLDRGFMSEELSNWVAREAGNPELANKLLKISRSNGKLSAFVFEILKDCGYCTVQESRDIFQILLEMEEKSDFECNKMRADRLMDKEKYLCSIYEYKRLLESKDCKEVGDQLKGDIWHNLGIAYARLFLFEEASDCFAHAYALNERQESLKCRLHVLRCMGRDDLFLAVAKENYLDDNAILGLENEISMCIRTQESDAFEQKVAKLEELLRDGKRNEYREIVQEMIFEWKEDYRRFSRI